MTIENLVRPSIKALKPYSSARDEFKDIHDNMVFLDANENPFNNGVNRYPDPQQRDLKALISTIKGVPSDHILLGNGSDEVLDLLIRVFCEPYQDNILILPPTYGMYEVLANVNAVQVLKVNLTEDTFQPELPAVLETTTAHSKLLFLCSPNNPTANSFEAASIEFLIKQFKGIVVIDEAYIDFSKQASWLSRLNEFPNLVVTQTLSKAYGMAGLRLGMCFASPQIITTLNKIKPPYNVNELTQARALKELKNAAAVASQINHLLQERDRLVKALDGILFIKKVYPSEANFVLVKVDDANARYRQLIENGVVIRNRTTQPLCENCLRLTVGTTEENSRLIKILKSL